MTPHDRFDALEAAIRAAGIEVARDELLGRAALVGHWKKFRWRWFATQLNLFVIACPFSSSDASKETLDRFLAAARDYAVRHKKGLPLGLQSGVAVIAVAVGDGFSHDAVDWAAHRPRARFAATGYPVLFDLRTGIATRPEHMVVGAVYLPYLRRFVDSVVAPALSQGG